MFGLFPMGSYEKPRLWQPHWFWWGPCCQDFHCHCCCMRNAWCFRQWTLITILKVWSLHYCWWSPFWAVSVIFVNKIKICNLFNKICSLFFFIFSHIHSIYHSCISSFDATVMLTASTLLLWVVTMHCIMKVACLSVIEHT